MPVATGVCSPRYAACIFFRRGGTLTIMACRPPIVRRVTRARSTITAADCDANVGRRSSAITCRRSKKNGRMARSGEGVVDCSPIS